MAAAVAFHVQGRGGLGRPAAWRARPARTRGRGGLAGLRQDDGGREPRTDMAGGGRARPRAGARARRSTGRGTGSRGRRDYGMVRRAALGGCPRGGRRR
jgi:hypothetical protein